MKNLVNDITKMQLDEATKVPKGTRKPLTAKPMPNDPKDPTVLVRGFGRMRKSQAEKAGMAYVIEETEKQWGEGPDDPVEHDITEVVVSSFPSTVKKIRDANKSEAEKIADKNLADKLKKMSPEEKVKKGWAHPSILDEAVETRIQMTMPLFIRLMEWSKEDAKTDMELHRVAERLAAVNGIADMDVYNDLVNGVSDKEDINESVHRISVTVSDPNHPAVTKRKEQIQKFAKVPHEAADKEGAIAKAKSFYQKRGYKVHSAEHVGFLED